MALRHLRVHFASCCLCLARSCRDCGRQVVEPAMVWATPESNDDTGLLIVTTAPHNFTTLSKRFVPPAPENYLAHAQAVQAIRQIRSGDKRRFSGRLASKTTVRGRDATSGRTRGRIKVRGGARGAARGGTRSGTWTWSRHSSHHRARSRFRSKNRSKPQLTSLSLPSADPLTKRASWVAACRRPPLGHGLGVLSRRLAKHSDRWFVERLNAHPETAQTHQKISDRS